MQIVGDKQLDSQIKFGLIRFSQVTPDSLKGDHRAHTEPGPRQLIQIPCSEPDLNRPGSKCEHGVYIPTTQIGLYTNRAEYCSICNPYVVEVPGGKSDVSADV